MAELSPRRFALLLALTPRIGGKTLARILTRMELQGDDPATWLRLSPEALKESYGLNQKQIASIAERSGAWSQTVEELERRLVEKDVRLLTLGDASFPEKLEAFDDNHPCALFCYGNLRLLDCKSFCVLSSRNTTPKGLEQIEKLTETGVFQSETLVVGHDRPEYQRAALVPLRWGSPRLLVFDRGIFHELGADLSQEPFRAARLWRYQFDPKTDLAVSPFKPDARFTGAHNKTRDRLIAALSDRLDFVEVAPGGNMEALARRGLACGRPVRVSDRAYIFSQLRELGAVPIES